MSPFRTRTTILLGALSGLLVAVSFPPVDLSYLAWLAWSPWMLALARAPSLRDAALSGAAHSACLHAAQCWWMVEVMRVHGEIGMPIALGMYAFGLLTVAPYGLAVGSATAFLARRHGAVALLALAPLSALIDVWRSHATLGHPWLIPGMTQAMHPSIAGAADIAGVHGLGIIVLLGNAAIAALVIGVRQPAARRRSFGVAAIAAGIVACALVHGVLAARRHAAPGAWARVIDLDEAVPAEGGLVREWPQQGTRAAIVQGAQPQQVKVRSSPEDDLLLARVQLDLTQRALSEGAQLIAWSESAHPDTTQDMPWLLPQLQHELRLAQPRVTDPEVVLGALVEEMRRGEQSLTNSALLVDSGGRAGRYDKRRLVPFGEYLPWKAIFGWFPQIVRNVGDMRAGESDDILKGRHGDLGVVVCYEVVLPQRFRDVTRNGADLLVNVTNDGWYHGTWMPEQHLRFAVMRAIETRRWMLRAANSGISAIISPDGRVVGRMEEGRRGLLMGPVERRTGSTGWLRWGNAPVVVAGLAVVAWLLAEAFVARRRAAPAVT